MLIEQLCEQARRFNSNRILKSIYLKILNRDKNLTIFIAKHGINYCPNYLINKTSLNNQEYWKLNDKIACVLLPVGHFTIGIIKATESSIFKNTVSIEEINSSVTRVYNRNFIIKIKDILCLLQPI